MCTNNDAIESFSGEFEFLSNFYMCAVEFDGVVWKSLEHAYQAAKTDSSKKRTEIYGLSLPGKAKKVGKKVPLRPGWDAMRIEVMRSLVRNKFTQNLDLRQKLLETGCRELVEGNSWGDKFWGKVDGKGRNELGKILMEVRAELVEEEAGAGAGALL